jgi:hypothetical protein
MPTVLATAVAIVRRSDLAGISITESLDNPIKLVQRDIGRRASGFLARLNMPFAAILVYPPLDGRLANPKNGTYSAKRAVTALVSCDNALA